MRAISQIQTIAPHSIEEILLCEDDAAAIKKLHNTCPRRSLTLLQFKTVCLSVNPSGPLAIVTLPRQAFEPVLPDERGSRVLVCEDVQDPGNIGTLIRTAAALDFSGVILSDKCADPFSPKAVQATAGAIMSVWIRRTAAYRNLVCELVETGFACVVADVRGSQKPGGIRAKKIALVLGNEGNGISKETLGLATHRIRIPINAKKAESLNVAVSGAICMYSMMEE
jgi:TrmH family RNA methyltransferase